MIDKIQLTLYEFFGYLLPGSIGAVAIIIFYWSLCLPHTALPLDKLHPDRLGWIILIGMCYLIGHLVQGLGTKYLKGAEQAALGSIPLPIVLSAKSRAASIADVDVEDIDPVSLFRLADEYTIQNGILGDRDIFVYREGFYKGCAVALALLSISLVIRSFLGTITLGFPSYTYDVSRHQIFVSALIIFLAAILCKLRFHRFGVYRVSRALFAFITLATKDLASQKNPK
ncbi:MAG TPA: hypothetical protein VFB79_08790 [Candidatus Angelobacter sp.]|nr:hypothetical protein [Candidatus Angelobacter sp.]